jgi:hypothetical protein
LQVEHSTEKEPTNNKIGMPPISTLDILLTRRWEGHLGGLMIDGASEQAMDWAE